VSLGPLYIITDGSDEHIASIKAALRALPPATAALQLRNRELSARDLHHRARQLKQLAREFRCPLLVNDRLDVALAAGADGVHLPDAGLDVATARRVARRGDFLIGKSAHSADAAGAAARDGADLVVCGPVWDTPSKRGMGEPLGLEELSRAARAVTDASQSHCMLYAIGGIESAERGRQAFEAGARGVAGIRAFSGALGDAAPLARALADAASE
jgi:thiamine-phosphate pyrophosphorylase